MNRPTRCTKAFASLLAPQKTASTMGDVHYIVDKLSAPPFRLGTSLVAFRHEPWRGRSSQTATNALAQRQARLAALHRAASSHRRSCWRCWAMWPPRSAPSRSRWAWRTRQGCQDSLPSQAAACSRHALLPPAAHRRRSQKQQPHEAPEQAASRLAEFLRILKYTPRNMDV